jgi:hypothetical protein
MECRLAGETEVLGENLPQRHFCPSQNPTCLGPVSNPGPHRWEAGVPCFFSLSVRNLVTILNKPCRFCVVSVGRKCKCICIVFLFCSYLVRDNLLPSTNWWLERFCLDMSQNKRKEGWNGHFPVFTDDVFRSE